MSLLQDRAWKLKYTLDDGDLIRLFYVPALRCAQRYHRTTGYFSAAALALAARGVEGLVLNDGRMKLLVGCTLDPPEIAAIERGEGLKTAVERALLSAPDFSASPWAMDSLELLAWMIARGYLDVKVAIPCDENKRPTNERAIFHEKTGIIEDKTGDRIAFAGSINETVPGWTRNWESFNCFTSWNDGPRVDEEEATFARLWAGKASRALVYDVPAAVREKLLDLLPDSDGRPKLLIKAEADWQGSKPIVIPPDATSPLAGTEVLYDVDERRSEIWRRIANAARQPNGGERVGEATSAIVPWAHQVRAFERLYHDWPPKLLIADEVGLGKTIQAGLLLRQAWLAGRIKRALVLAPKSVCKQWQIELREKFNLNWPIYDGHKLVWYGSPAREHCTEREVSRAEWHKEPFVIMSSHLARRQDRRPELLEASEGWDVVVLDEAHHARRRGAGTQQESGPNALLRLMRDLKNKTEGLILLTATPLQIHPVELWDLLSLLGLPSEWTSTAFERFFQEVRREVVTNESLDWLSHLFRAAERTYRELSREEAERTTGLARLKSKKVLAALRSEASIPRRQLSPDERKAAVALIRRATPVRALISRHTRELLRRYAAAGKIDARIANRRVEDRFINLSSEERGVYRAVENYISSTYDAASQEDRNAVGFVMTIYRRRLASSFYALRNTLEKRRAGVGVDEQRLEEDAADLLEAGEELDPDALSDAERQALEAEEKASIESLVQDIGLLPTDTKAVELVSVLKDLRASGYPQAIVFTQFTDTMDYLRDLLAQRTGLSVMCFSGRGGEVVGVDGVWKAISREEVKRRFKEGKSDLLVCTDAAAEGLNFQFCGALVNYDMPWNPMRVEQRIGRIDRLGQRFTDIRIVNLHYADTVETDVYMAARQRIQLFESVVGGLQPILARLPTLIRDTVLEGTSEPERTQGAIRQLEAAIQTTRAEGIDIDDFADVDLEMPPRPDPAITLSDLREILDHPTLLPLGSHAAPLDGQDYRFENGELPKAIRVTTNRDFFELHSDSVEFWTPGSPAFPDLRPYQDAA